MANLSNINNKFLVTTGGNVGINTTSPSHKLDVTNVGGDAINVGAGNDFTGIRWTGDNHAFSWRIGGDSFFIYDVINAAQRVTINDSGNVGIGETNPDKLLHLKSTGATGIAIESTTNAQNLDIDFYNNAGAAAGRIRYEEGPGSIKFFPNSGATTAALSLAFSGFASFAGNVTVGGGTLNLGADVSGSASLNFTTNGFADISNVGTGAMRFKPSGSTLALTLTGVNAAFAGNIVATSYIQSDNNFLAKGDIKFRNNADTSWDGGQIGTDANDALRFAVKGLLSSNVEALSIAKNTLAATFAGNVTVNGGNLNLNTASSGNANLSFDGNDLKITSNSSSANLKLETNSTTRLTINSSGNVGIGTTNPLQPFQVDAGSSIASFRSVGSGQNNKELLIQTGGDRVILDAKNASDGTATALAFELGSSEKIRITSSGNVGIGTTSPARPLSVNSSQISARFTSSSADSQIEIIDSSGTVVFGSSSGNAIVQAGGAERMRIHSNGRVSIGSTTASANTLTLAGSAVELDIHNTSGKRWRLNADTSGNLRFEDKTGGTEVMRLASNGNVGIGTTSPSQNLQVSGSIYSSGVGSALLFDTTGALGSNGIKTINDFETLIFNGRGAAGFAVIGNSNIRFGFGTNYTNAETDLFISSAGNVGIGTSSPASKLEIFGGGNTLRMDSAGNTAKTFLMRNVNTATAEIKTDGNLDINIEDANRTMRFLNGNTERMRINSSGRVGIGATSLSEKLRVQGDSGSDLLVRFQPFTNNAQTKLYLSSVSSGDGGYFYNANDNTSGLFAYGDYTFYVGTSNIGGSIGNARMIIKQDGNVGIGKTSPVYKLDVAGEIGTDSYIRHNGDTNTFFGFSGDDAFKARTGGSDRFHINNNGMGGYNPWNNVSTPDQTNTSFNSSIQNVFAGNAMKYLGQQQIRDGSRYIDIALNSSQNNIMYYFYVIGYLYNRGSIIAWSSGYTYTNNSILNKNNVIVASAGTTKVINSYRGEDGVNGDYEGHLCLRVDTGANSYSEGYIAYYIGSHTPNWMSAVSIAAYAQNDQSTGNWFDQGIP